MYCFKATLSLMQCDVCVNVNLLERGKQRERKREKLEGKVKESKGERGKEEER